VTGKEPGLDRELTPENQKSVWRMFSSIAPYYDLLNHLLSLNIDRYWRSFGVRRLLKHSPGQCLFLDLAAGTGDVTFTILHQGRETRVLAVDPAIGMLSILQKKASKMGGEGRVFPVAGDGLLLPLPSACVDGAIVAFGIRNIPDRTTALREMRRTIRAGGSMVILEFSKPRGIFGLLYNIYFHQVLPFLGRVISKDPAAYSYLPRTVEEFPAPSLFAQLIAEAGFSKVRYWQLTGGVVTCYLGVVDR